MLVLVWNSYSFWPLIQGAPLKGLSTVDLHKVLFVSFVDRNVQFGTFQPLINCINFVVLSSKWNFYVQTGW